MLLSRLRLTRSRILEKGAPHSTLCIFKMTPKGLGVKRYRALFQVNWEGGHSSSFPLDWLKERSFREEARALYREKVLVSGRCHLLKGIRDIRDEH